MDIINMDRLVNEENAGHNQGHASSFQHPFRTLICGSSGSGKSNLLLNLLLRPRYLYFDKLYLYAKTLNQSKYRYLAEQIQQKCALNKLDCSDFFFSSSDLDDVIALNELDPTVQNLIIFDDVLLEKNQSVISEYFVAGRHANCSVIYLSQSYFKTPQLVRLNCNYFCIYETTGNNLTELAKEHGGSLEPKVFKELFRKAVSDPYSFFLIDKKTRDKKMRYRRNFDHLLTT
eukprot:Lithocolla_globosa_v1_NODE_1_length_16663_cov_42.954359.p8 type:complete len:231 gc:universal NODE_1_length_16663_cov_42.954359:4342-3650(-)